MDVKTKGCCDASIAEIGTRAGCGPTLTRNAIRMAETLGLIVVTQRPRKGAKHLTNVIRIIGAELKAWIDRGGHRVQKDKPLQREFAFREERKAKLELSARAMRMGNGGRHRVILSCGGGK